MSAILPASPASLLHVEQRTEEWRQQRAGKVTASAITDVLAKGKGAKESASRANYRAQIVSEVLTGRPLDDSFISRPMQWGIDNEPFARAAYELAQDVLVDTAGFLEHSRIECFGASPDGLVGSEGLVQIKCPNTATHIEYLLKGEVPADYQPQMLAEMACTGRAWSDFVSFDPRLPLDLQMFVKRLARNEERIAEIEGKVVEFLAECKDTLARLSCLRDLEGTLRQSLAIVQAKRAMGPQPVVEVLDRLREDEIPF